MTDVFAITIQLIVEDPQGNILLAKGRYDEDRFGYLATSLGYDRWPEYAANQLARQLTVELVTPTLEIVAFYRSALNVHPTFIFRLQLAKALDLPEPPEGISEWRWFTPAEILKNKKVAPTVRHDCGEITGPFGSEYLVSGKRPQWPKEPQAA